VLVLLSLAGCECRPECLKKRLHWNRSAPAVDSVSLNPTDGHLLRDCKWTRSHWTSNSRWRTLRPQCSLCVYTPFDMYHFGAKGTQWTDPWADRSDPGLGSTDPSPKIRIGLIHSLVHGSQMVSIHESICESHPSQKVHGSHDGDITFHTRCWVTNLLRRDYYPEIIHCNSGFYFKTVEIVWFRWEENIRDTEMERRMC
jgi:hypothetical protein